VNQEKYKKSLSSVTPSKSLYALIVSLGLSAFCGTVQALPAGPSDNPQAQKAFDTPQAAAESLIHAAETYDVFTLLEIFGPESKEFISSADPIRDKNNAEGFAARAHEKNSVTVDVHDKTRAVLSVGKDDWPLPIPIVKRKGKWYFDSQQGRDEILFRRIGANELDALQICRGL
jgi:hypothetical protein